MREYQSLEIRARHPGEPFAGTAAWADGSGDPAVASSDDGKYADKDGNPTFKISQDGTVDWYTYSGFRRYHSDCHVCHGPDGEGSSYASALAESLKTPSDVDFRIPVALISTRTSPALGPS